MEVKLIPDRILLTDTHSDKDNTESIEDIFDQCFDLADELGIDRICHLGDVFTDRTGQTLKVLLSFQRIIKKAEEREIRIEFIPGNHDKTNLESEDSYLDLFNESPNVEVYRRYHISKEDDAIHCYLPYFKEDTVYRELLEEMTDKVQKILDKMKTPCPVYLYTHIAVNGVKNNGGTKVENTLKYAMFKIFTKVFIGHYHNQSRVGKNIFYIGSGKPKDFGENDQKGYTILYKNGEHKFVQAKFKKYIKVYIDLSTTDRDEILKLKAQYANSEDYVRFIFEGNTEQFAQFENDFNLLKKAGIEVKREDTNILKAMEAAQIGGKVEFTYKLIKKYFLEFCIKNKDQITPVRRSRGLKYIDILKDY